MLRHIEHVMKAKKVHQLPPSATAYQAACLMKENGCGAVVVATRSRLDGIFTSGDLVKRVAAEKRDPAKTKLAEVMTPKPDTVRRTSLAIDALRMMQDGHYRHLPVVEEGRLVGIVSRRDFFGQEESIVEEEDRISEVMR
jgi:CBS domain-containing protein